jgi:hypothetical protein
MFGHSYAVGLFTVIWIILTVVGIFLFLQYLRSSDENRGDLLEKERLTR